MHGHAPREDPLTDMGYEVRDVNYSALKITAIIFFLFTIGCALVVGIWFYLYKPQMTSTVDLKKPMPAIELQSNITTRSDIATFRQAETSRLESTGPNPDGSYHIPIEDAMNEIADRGLPHSETSTPAFSPGNTIKQNAVGRGTAR